MSSNDISHKIQKYTYKLKNTTSKKNAKIYQNKLQEYHKLNKNLQMLGGGEKEEIIEKTVEEAYKKLKEDLASQQEMITEKLKNLSEIQGIDKNQLSALETSRDQLISTRKISDTNQKALMELSDSRKSLVKQISDLTPKTGLVESEQENRLVTEIMGKTEELLGNSGDFIASIFGKP